MGKHTRIGSLCFHLCVCFYARVHSFSCGISIRPSVLVFLHLHRPSFRPFLPDLSCTSHRATLVGKTRRSTRPWSASCPCPTACCRRRPPRSRRRRPQTRACSAPRPASAAAAVRRRTLTLCRSVARASKCSDSISTECVPFATVCHYSLRATVIPCRPPLSGDTRSISLLRHSLR